MARAAWWQAFKQFLPPAARRPCRLASPARRHRPGFDILEARLPPTVTLSVSDPAPFPKPDTGQIMGLFVVTRSGDLGPALQVNYATRDGTGAKAAHAGLDYVATSGTLTFAPNQTTATITVPVLGNNVFQAGKTFTVSLSDPLYNIFNLAPQQTFATGRLPRWVAVGDFNGDGKPDLVTADALDNTVSVLLNTTPAGAATPTFGPRQSFASPNSFPSSVAVGDFNGDGKPDLAFPNYIQNTVVVLLNMTPTGATAVSFAPQQTFATGFAPYAVAAGDINGDGKPDLAVTNGGDNTVSVLLNQTQPGATIPSFAPQQTFATGQRPLALSIGDLNGDGKPDLAIANANPMGSLGTTVSVLLNLTPTGATTPSFTPQQTFTTGYEPRSVAVADINGDGKPDLVVGNEFGQANLSVLLNTTPAGATTASFAPQQTFSTGNSQWLRAVTVGDFNGDGKLDVAVANENGGSVSVLLNATPTGATAASFTPPLVLNTGRNSHSLAVADINGDGKPDLAVANYGTNTVSVLLNTRVLATVSPSFALQQTFAPVAYPFSVAVADFNGDGKPDLAITSLPTPRSGLVAVLLNTTPDGATSPSFAPPQTFTIGAYPPSAVVVGDFNGDGKPDLAIASGTVAVLLNTTPVGATAPSFAPSQLFPAYAVSLVVADINGDGRPDIACVSGGSQVSILLNTTPLGATIPSFAPRQTFDALAGYTGSIAVGDFNGDGKPDVAVSSLRYNFVSVLLNTTPVGATIPSFVPPQQFMTGTGDAFKVAVGDVNGDGKPDLVVADYLSTTVSVLLNTTPTGATSPSFAPPQTFAAGGNRPYTVAVADLHGDGAPDLVLANSASNTVSLLLNTTPAGAGILSFALPQTFASGRTPSLLAVGDLNGDGQPDLIVVNDKDSTVSVLFNTGAPIALSRPLATGTISSAEEAPATITPVDGSTPQAAEVGEAFAVPPAVEVRDAAGHVVQGVRVTFKAPRRGPSGTFDGNASVTVVTNAQGQAAAPLFVADTIAGSYTVTAHAAGGNRPSTDFSLTNTPAAAVAFQVLTPASVASGTPFDVTVLAVDPYGNVDTDYQGTVHFSTTDGNRHVVLPADYAFQPGDAGQVTFVGGVTLITSGEQMLTVTDGDNGISGSATVTVSRGVGLHRPPGHGVASNAATAPVQAVRHRRSDYRIWLAPFEVGLIHRRLVIGPLDVAWVDDAV